tara:strand:+ start:497 stop:682 length:186 start_codon:yes stop_codon:yes gene_type:complete
MSKKDLKQFIKKVDSLKAMVKSIESNSERRIQLEACSNHDQVVQLAKSWGFEIGSRWGEES